MKRHIWEIRERSAEEWMEERGKGWRQSGRKRGNVCRKITPWISERDSRTDWKKKTTRKHKIWSFSTGEIETTQGLQTEIQADRQTDPKWLCQSVHDQLVHDSTVTHLHLTTIPPTPLCRFVDYTDAPSHPSYVSQRGCDMTSGGPRACSWQLFISHPLQSLPCCGPSVKCFQPCSCSSAPHAS